MQIKKELWQHIYDKSPASATIENEFSRGLGTTDFFFNVSRYICGSDRDQIVRYYNEQGISDIAFILTSDTFYTYARELKDGVIIQIEDNSKVRPSLYNELIDTGFQDKAALIVVNHFFKEVYNKRSDIIELFKKKKPPAYVREFVAVRDINDTLSHIAATLVKVSESINRIAEKG